MNSSPFSRVGVEPAVRDQLLAAIPSLRAFAFSLTNNRDRADDLVQETITRAWARLDRFERGTNLNAWLFTILRNALYSEHRSRKREVEDPDGVYSQRFHAHPEQQSHVDFEDFRRALAKLPSSQREAIVLVAAEQLSYEEAASVCGVPVGTIKSRVHRGREQLAKLLDVTTVEDIGPDRISRAAMQP